MKSILKKGLVSLTITASAVFAALELGAAVTVKTYEFLNYYDQLTAYNGKPGSYFVRDAAGTTTGQHGDPTVKKGWAIYVWDQRGQTNGSGKWTKVAEEETLDVTVNELLLAQYATKASVQQLIDKVYEEIGKSGSAEEIQRLNELIGTLDRRVENAENNITVVRNDITRIETKTDTTAQQVASVKEQIREITGEGISEMSNRVDQLTIAVEQLNTQLSAIETALQNLEVGEKDSTTVHKLYDALKSIKQIADTFRKKDDDENLNDGTQS